VEFETIAHGYPGHLEAPRVGDDGSLWFTEIFEGGGVHRRHPDGRDERFLVGHEHLLGLVVDESGGLVVSNLAGSLSLWDPATDEIRPVLAPVQGFVNDIEADTSGSVWAGVVDFQLPTTVGAATANLASGMKDTIATAAGHRPTSLLRIDPDGTVTTMWEEGEASNGLGFSPDGRILYQCDTLLGVFAYDVTAERGLTDRRLFAQVPEGKHNGLAVDAEGGVWVAATGGGSLVRFRPDGVIDQDVAVPARFVMSLVFDDDRLYVVTSDNLEHPERQGTVLRARVDVPGSPSPGLGSAEFPPGGEIRHWRAHTRRFSVML
jgi:sugar lactone lactonase YvrE